MKRRCLSMIVVAFPAALAFACAADAQQTPPQPRPQPPPQTQMPQQQMRRQQTQPAVPATTQTRHCAAGTDCYDNNTDRDTHRMSRTAPKFSTLAGSKGYVTRADMSGHRWWANPFSQCDSNHDDKLTRSEYDTCRTQH